MPELSTMEARLPDLHLPEIQRDDISRSLSNIHLPEIHLPRFDLGAAFSKLALPRRQPQPRRWPLALGGMIVAGLASWAVMSNEALRARLSNAVRTIRERIATMRANRVAVVSTETDEPMALEAVEAVETMPIVAPSGANDVELISVFEESGSPA